MNLHYFITFSSRGSGVCRSLFLRTFMVMMLFITGSNGIFAGKDLQATIGTPQSNGSWKGTVNEYSWKESYYNLMPIFTITKGTLNTDYVALKFTTSKYTDKYRVCFMNGGDVVATFTLESAGAKTIKISELKVNEGKDLSQVDNIKFGGDSKEGSITLDPNSIVLVGQSKITVSPSETGKGTVYFTIGNDATQHTSATVPNHTKVKFYANPNTEKHVVFTGWGGDGDGKYWNNPAEVEVTGDLNFIARFPDGIHISCTVEPKGAAEPDVYQKDHPEWKLPVDGYVGPDQATTFAFKNMKEQYKFLGWYDEKNKELSKETSYTVDNINVETNVIAKFSTSEINEEREITVDGKTRKYWLYVPASVEGKKDVPVVFSLHGRGNNDTPSDYGKPIFTSLADKEGFIVVYPQGRNGGEKPNDWNNGFVGTTGWEATGKENADTKFIKALVDEIKKIYNSNSNISVDPKKFYLCGFSMGGMMTYACAKVLNGTFAAYGSCGGFPLNEFHLNLATKQPVPFMHLHGDADGIVGINHLHTIIENLLFRNGCNLKDFATTDKWEEASYNGSKYNYKKYDFTGVKDVPVTTVTFKDLGHVVHASAPQYLWDFFSPKTLDSYQTTTMKWQWDMKTINSNLSASNGYPYGWERVAVSETTHGTLTYGNNRKGNCSIQGCIGATNGCNGNHNVYNSIQLEKGTYKLHAKAHVVSSDATGIIVGNI